MKSLKILPLFILCIAPFVFAQIQILFPSSKKVLISWEHSWKDVNGNPEHVTHFELDRKEDNSSFLPLFFTPKDTISYRPITSFIDSTLEDNHTYQYRVQAVDWAGNKSSWEYSLKASSGWEIITDSTPPSAPTNFIGIGGN